MTIRALVCDDDTPVRNMVRDLLEERGVEVFEAKDGQEALAVFVKEPVDLVITDFLMPKIDGLQVIRSIRLSGEKGRVPVILMSAISKSQILGNHPDMEPDHYVSKPFKPRKMAKVLERVLQDVAGE